jgi:hypothetical protein
MEKLLGVLAPAVTVVCFLGVAIPIVQMMYPAPSSPAIGMWLGEHHDRQPDGDLPPFPAPNYVALTAVSGVTTAVSQQFVVTNTITGQLHVGDVPTVRVVDAP